MSKDEDTSDSIPTIENPKSILGAGLRFALLFALCWLRLRRSSRRKSRG